MLSVPDWREFPYVSFDNKKDLPDMPGIYIVTSDHELYPLYIGKAEDQSIKRRHLNHDKRSVFLEKKASRIYYCPIDDIDTIAGWEKLLIRHEKPVLNKVNNPEGVSVIKMLRKAGVTKNNLWYDKYYGAFFLKGKDGQSDFFLDERLDLLAVRLSNLIYEYWAEWYCSFAEKGCSQVVLDEKIEKTEEYEEMYSRENIYEQMGTIKNFFNDPRSTLSLYSSFEFKNGVWDTDNQVFCDGATAKTCSRCYDALFQPVYKGSIGYEQFFLDEFNRPELKHFNLTFSSPAKISSKSQKWVCQFSALLKTVLVGWCAEDFKTFIRFKESRNNNGAIEILEELLSSSGVTPNFLCRTPFLFMDRGRSTKKAKRIVIEVCPPPLDYDYYFDNIDSFQKEFPALLNIILPDQNLPKEIAFKWLGIN